MVNVGQMSLLGLAGDLVSQYGLRQTVPANATCGGPNILYIGYPAYHPYVTEQGYNGAEVDYSLRMGAADLVKAGYNTRVIWSGPEVPLHNLAERTADVEWDAYIIGWGIRGHANATSTQRHEDIHNLFRQVLPSTPILYNWGPHSFVEAITRRISINNDCTDAPGRLYAYEELCDPNICPKTLNVTDGSLDTLLAGLQVDS